MTAIETRGLGKRYDNGVFGVRSLELTVARGEVFGLLGPNGSGKTTTVRLLNGTLSPTTGTAEVLGLPMGSAELRLRTATVAELANMYEAMSARENLRFFGLLYDLAGAEIDRRIERLLSAFRLSEWADEKLGTFSTGMRKRVQLARALLHEPTLLFLDEPTSGLDPEAALEVLELIREAAEERGETVLMCTHNLSLAERICDSVGFLADGELVRYGRREEILDEAQGTPTLKVVTETGEETVAYERSREINDVLRRTMDAGEHILEVHRLRPSLEEAYFHFIGRSGGAGAGGRAERAAREAASGDAAAGEAVGREAAAGEAAAGGSATYTGSTDGGGAGAAPAGGAVPRDTAAAGSAGTEESG